MKKIIKVSFDIEVEVLDDEAISTEKEFKEEIKSNLHEVDFADFERSIQNVWNIGPTEANLVNMKIGNILSVKA